VSGPSHRTTGDEEVRKMEEERNRLRANLMAMNAPTQTVSAYDQLVQERNRLMEEMALSQQTISPEILQKEAQLKRLQEHL
jgi:hypothetical protein